MLQLLLVFGIWIPLIQSLYLENDYVLGHAEPVVNFRVLGHNEGPNLIEHGHWQPHADEVQISFSAFSKLWDFKLEVDHEIFSPTTVFHFYGDDGHTSVLPHHTLYKTKFGEFPEARVNIYDDGTIHGMFVTEDGHFTVDPASEFPEFNLDTKMGMYSLSDLSGLKIELPHRNGTITRTLSQVDYSDANPKAYASTTLSNDAGEPARWTACYPTATTAGVEKKFAMGFAVSNEYYTKIAGGTPAGIQNHLKNLLADSNSIYVPQMGVHLYIETTDIRTTAGATAAAPWNLAQQAATATNGGCGKTASTVLGEFRVWRQNVHPSDAGLWHLMTTCFPAPGTVGVAYLNALCSARVGSGLSSSGTRATWTVVAHEIGHNFGGQHSFEDGQGRTGGIMDYGPGTLANIYQFNTKYRKAEICQRIATSMAQQTATQTCWSNFVVTGTEVYTWTRGAKVCSVTCGLGTDTEKIECKNKAGAVVSDTLCSPPRPEGAVTTPCANSPACAAPVCGNGKLEGAEVCDDGTANNGPTKCCNTDCLTQNIVNCKNSRDACFVSIKNERAYCFQNNAYNRYQPVAAVQQKEATYPREISKYWLNLPKTQTSDFTTLYDAIIQRPEGRIYLLKGNEFSVYELGFGAHNGYPQTMQTFFGLPATWTKVDAAVSLRSGQGGAYIFKGLEYCKFLFGQAATDACTTPRPITDWNAGKEWPMAGVDSAMRYWPDIGLKIPELDSAVDLMFQGKFLRYKFGTGLIGFNGEPATTPHALTDFGITTQTIDETKLACQSTGCADCPVTNECKKCDTDFQLIGAVCYPNEYIVELLFDPSTLTSDNSFIETKQVTKFNEVKGVTGNAAVFTEGDFIKLKSSRFPTNMEDFEFHFWVNVDSAHPYVDTSLVAGIISHGTQTYTFTFYLKACAATTPTLGTNCYNPSYKLVSTTNTAYELVSDFNLVRGEWKHLIATLQNGLMRLTIDGLSLEIPIDDSESSSTAADSSSNVGMSSNPWRFIQMDIGKSSQASTMKGFAGMLDQFHVDSLKSFPGGGTAPVGAAKGFGCNFLVFLSIAIVAIYQSM